MPLSLVTPPAAEPLDVESEVKIHCRIDLASTLENARLLGLVKSARGFCEQVTQRQLITASWLWILGCWSLRPDGALHIPFPPLQAVTKIEYYDTSDAKVELPTAAYVVETPAGPRAGKGRVYLKPGYSWPALSSRPGAVEVSFRAGYGDTADKVPETLKSAMLLLIGELYERREDAVVGTISGPAAVSAERLMWPYRVMDVAA